MEEKKLCACGCGEICNNTFKKGHNIKDKHLKTEYIKKRKEDGWFKEPSKARKNMSSGQLKRKEKFGYINSPETRKKIGKKTKLQFINGMPEETKKKIGLKNKGHIVLKKSRKKISLNLRGVHNSPNTEFKKGQISLKKGKNYEEIYGEEKAKKLRKKLRIAKSNPSEKTRKKQSKSQKERFKNGVPKETKQKMRIAMINYIKEICGIIRPNIGRNEKQILDKLEQELDYKIIRQFEIEGYFIDGYIPELGVVIEVDEKPKNTEKDIERQKIIEWALNCKFIRINDFD